MEELKQYDLVILSDIGANTLLLPGATFNRSEKMPNRCNLIRDYVNDGGALLMVGGYLTFSGVDAKGKWHDTAVQEVLPVEVLTVDDRMEHCEGVKPVTVGEHEALKGIPTDWPEVLDYNKVIAKPEAEVPVTVEGDPFIAFASLWKRAQRCCPQPTVHRTGHRRNSASGNTTINCGKNIADWLIQK